MAVALYARVSTARQAENELSIPDQLQQMRDWCKREGHLIVREYVEPGATATDDKRPSFQQMMQDAMASPAPFELIVIHSLSRFFRDVVEFGVHEKKLKRNGVKIVSITQQTADDSMGEMSRKMFSLFDEYQSKENSKHTSRAMRENARQGFFNGSRAPFGYRAVATDIPGSRGRKKKRIEIDEAEAAVVRLIYDLYLHGDQCKTVGIKEIVKHLTGKGLSLRGSAWSIQTVHRILSASAYIGEHYFNVRDSKTGQIRPEAEWIMFKSAPIIDRATFEQVRKMREARAPGKIPPRVTSSPTLLTGLLKCGECGSNLTLATGKSGRFKYYKCTNRRNKGNHACSSRSIPMQKLDDLVLSHLAEHVLSPQRLNQLISELRKRVKDSKQTEQEQINRINRQLKDIELRQARLLDAVETGNIPNDASLQRRAQQLKAAREELLIELAGVRRSQAMPVERILPSNIAAFSKAICKKLSDQSGFAKSYLRVLVDEIVVKGELATITGSYGKLASAIAEKKKGTDQVPSFMGDWRARLESNQRPLASEANTLSPELRARGREE